jgi:SAM-dependent methyltransferase
MLDKWEIIYKNKEQLNMYPYTEVVSFFIQNYKNHNIIAPKALDVGCGSGVHSAFLADFGFEVKAIDHSEYGIKNAKNLFPNKNIEYITSSFKNFTSNYKFDFVLDRLSTSHTNYNETKSFYKKIIKNLNDKAKILWFGFSDDNSGKLLGEKNSEGGWQNFRSGIFQELGQVEFFTIEDVKKIFKDFTIQNIEYNSKINMLTKNNHSYWKVEVVYEK